MQPPLPRPIAVRKAKSSRRFVRPTARPFAPRNYRWRCSIPTGIPTAGPTRGPSRCRGADARAARRATPIASPGFPRGRRGRVASAAPKRSPPRCSGHGNGLARPGPARLAADGRAAPSHILMMNRHRLISRMVSRRSPRRPGVRGASADEQRAGPVLLGGRLGDNIRERQGMAYTFRARGPECRRGNSPSGPRGAANVRGRRHRRRADPPVADGVTEKELNESRTYSVAASRAETNAAVRRSCRPPNSFRPRG